jgi:hypothetical protein
MKNVLLIGIAFSLVACSTVSPKAAKIQVHSQMSTLLSNCKNLGPVEGIAKWPEDYDHAKVYLREAAADKNGDTVVILNRDRNAFSETIQGTALRCFP